MNAKVKKAVQIVRDAVDFAQRDLSEGEYTEFLNELCRAVAEEMEYAPSRSAEGR